MAFNENRQADDHQNKAAQKKLSEWWADLKKEDRRKMIKMVKAELKPDVAWEEIPKPAQKSISHAGMMMVRMTKKFPK